MAVETERRVTPGLGFPALPGHPTAPLWWPLDDGVDRGAVPRESSADGQGVTESTRKPTAPEQPNSAAGIHGQLLKSLALIFPVPNVRRRYSEASLLFEWIKRLDDD